MRWRMIDYTENDAFLNMAIDEAISESVGKGQSLPTIRFYGWNPSAVSIGYFQGINEEVDLERCKDLGVDVVRRRTGGGAVYHDRDGEITYSVIAKEELFPKDIIASYQVICGWIIDSLQRLGINSEFKPINDIVVQGPVGSSGPAYVKKISGNAQTRRSGVLLQHGTILYEADVKKMFSILKVPSEKMRDKLVKNASERVISVSDLNHCTKDGLYRALISGFSENKEVFFDSLGKEEIERAESLATTRYKTIGWNLMR
jgi:lipoate-protein ligase A